MSGLANAGDKGRDKSALNRPVSQFAPSWKGLIALFLAALTATVLCYNRVLNDSYQAVQNAVVSATVVDTTLRTFPQFPIGPIGATDKARLTTKLDRAAAFEVLKAWGVLPRTLQLAQIFKATPAATAEAVAKEQADLVDTLVRCTNESTIQEARGVALLRCALPDFGGANKSGTNCFWDRLNLALAGIPRTAAQLADEVTKHLAGAGSAVCPATLRLALDWFGEARDEAAMVRAVLLTTGAVKYPGVDTKVEGGADDLVAPDWWFFSPLHRRFLEEIVSRIESDRKVKDAWSWVVLWRGPEQFLLVFTGLLLLFMLINRVWRRAVVEREAEAVFSALPNRLVAVRNTERGQRSAAARQLAAELEAEDGEGNSRFFPEDPDGPRARANSLVVYLAEKAVRRIVIEPREPELFRQTCDSISDAVERSGWLLRYAARALPAVGFIGTVRGIMLALPAAQNLFGTTGPEQIAALGGVIEPLGLAFATTLIALVAGLITGLIGDWEITQEQGLLARIEETLIDHIDPAEEPPVPEPEPQSVDPVEPPVAQAPMTPATPEPAAPVARGSRRRRPAQP